MHSALIHSRILITPPTYSTDLRSLQYSISVTGTNGLEREAKEKRSGA